MLIWMLDGNLRAVFGMGQESIVYCIDVVNRPSSDSLERLDTTSRSFLELMDHV